MKTLESEDVDIGKGGSNKTLHSVRWRGGVALFFIGTKKCVDCPEPQEYARKWKGSSKKSFFLNSRQLRGVGGGRAIKEQITFYIFFLFENKAYFTYDDISKN